MENTAGTYEPYYKMKYNDSLSYPSRLSTRQDHWGYYSENGDPTTLIPNVNYNRAADSVWNQIGALKVLYYPTGGYSKFTYETNTVGNLPWDVANVIKRKMIGTEDTLLIAIGQTSINFTIPSSERPINDSITIYNSLMNSGSVLNPLPGDPNPPYLGNATIYLINNNTADSILIPYRGEQIIQIDTGVNYTLHASYFIYDTSVINIFGLGTYWNYTVDNPGNKLVGGLRIKSLTDFDGLGHKTNIRKFSYILPGTDSSSGVIDGYPMYKKHIIYATDFTHAGLSFCCYDAKQSFSSYPLISDNGTPAGYSYVKEQFGNDGEGGMKEYYYSYLNDFTFFSRVFPYTPILFHDWQAGLLLHEKVYQKAGNEFNLVRTNKFNYSLFSTMHDDYSLSVKIGVNATYRSPDQIPGPPNLFGFATKEYYSYSGRNELESNTITDYRNGEAVKSVTTYHYDPDYFYKTDESMVNSDGLISKTAYTYPPDMAASSVRTAMLDKNMIGLPVSTKTYSNSTLTSTVLNNFGLFNGNQIELKNKQSSTYNNALQTEVTFNKYDNKGNLLSYTTRQGISTAFLWGYNSTYPVAQIEHVDTTALTTYLNTNTTIQTTCNNPASDQALRNVIQQLRNQFPNALITGMTYRPPLGMTSKTDPNNMVTYYDYDSFGRLADIKDKDGKILKKYTYHYRPQ